MLVLYLSVWGSWPCMLRSALLFSLCVLIGCDWLIDRCGRWLIAGLPWLISILSGRRILISSDGAVQAILLLLVVSLAFLFALLFYRMTLRKGVGFIMMTVYAAFLTYEWVFGGALGTS